eukprot:CAMPEP_0174826578 /NCGR_PEP_ID=MMETSP1107-20130205/44279_1 /TAXON_ID=36770 /ORGANISM="Paraphysomonas vestita, Strain GFlagA" /LENGTH=73 /DNA_ID=CAMNT_0016060093 /DNA_START=285 /DNA_END=505 /DNA_ORIENTATION=-
MTLMIDFSSNLEPNKIDDVVDGVIVDERTERGVVGIDVVTTDDDVDDDNDNEFEFDNDKFDEVINFPDFDFER